jgi:hypothetical protein
MRIGISIEDVIVEENSLLGDGVNVASRVHQSAAPDEIVVTQPVRDFVWNKLPLALQDLGEQRFKNVSRPIRTYRVLSDVGSAAWRCRCPGKPGDAGVAVPQRRRRGALLRRRHGRGDRRLFVAQSLFVIARNSTLKYRNHDSTASLFLALGVRYLLEGSVQRHKQRLRIHAVLLDAASNREIWSGADRVDEDLFTFQDQIASSISAGRPACAGESRASRSSDKQLRPYDCVLRGLGR